MYHSELLSKPHWYNSKIDKQTFYLKGHDLWQKPEPGMFSKMIIDIIPGKGNEGDLPIIKHCAESLGWSSLTRRITKIKLNVSNSNNKMIICLDPITLYAYIWQDFNPDNETSNCCQNLIITNQILIIKFATCQPWENLSFVQSWWRVDKQWDERMIDLLLLFGRLTKKVRKLNNLKWYFKNIGCWVGARLSCQDIFCFAH